MGKLLYKKSMIIKNNNNNKIKVIVIVVVIVLSKGKKVKQFERVKRVESCPMSIL